MSPADSNLHFKTRCKDFYFTRHNMSYRISCR